MVLVIKVFLLFVYFQPKYICVNGDGTVPVESAKVNWHTCFPFCVKHLFSSYVIKDQLTFFFSIISIFQADGLDAIARIGVPADHRGIICNRHVFRILKHWLKAGDPDPFYNPLNDFVILPTAFESGDHNKDTDVHVTSVEDWQLLSQNNGNGSDDLLAMVGSLSVSCEGMDSLTDGAHVTVTVQQTDRCIGGVQSDRGQ